jgi:hypothetical protein
MAISRAMRGAGSARRAWRGQRAQPGQRHGRGERAERAVRMHRKARAGGAIDAAAHLVPRRQGQQHGLAWQAAQLRLGQQRGHDLDAGMALGVQIALVKIVPGAGHAVDHRGVGGCRAKAGAEQR